MSRNRNTSINKVTGGLVAVATGVAAVTTGAGTAEATCISISGLNNGGGCTSTAGSIAIAIGAHAIATANGVLNVSMALGAHAAAVTVGNLDTALAVGDYAVSEAGLSPGDVGNLSVDITPGTAVSEAVTGGGGVYGRGVGNTAMNLGGPGNIVESVGQFNSASNVGGMGGEVLVVGSFNRAINLGGTANVVEVWAGSGQTPGLSSAFNVLGSHNAVRAGNNLNPKLGGPFAIAGTIGVSNHDGGVGHKPPVTQQHTGINIKTPVNDN